MKRVGGGELRVMTQHSICVSHEVFFFYYVIIYKPFMPIHLFFVCVTSCNYGFNRAVFLSILH